MAYNFSEILKFDKKISNGFYGLNAQQTKLKNFITNLKNKNQNFSNKGKREENLKNILFAQDELKNSKLIRDIAALENKKVLEAIDAGFVNEAQGKNRPHTYKYKDTTTIEEFRGRIETFRNYTQKLFSNQLISENELINIGNQINELENRLNTFRKTNIQEPDQISIENDLMQEYNALILQTRLSNYATSVYFLAEKAAAYIDNTGIDTYSQEKLDKEVIRKFHSGVKGSAPVVSSGGSKKLAKKFEEKGYKNSGRVQGELIFSETFDKADFIVKDEENSSIGVSVKTTLTGNKKISLQGSSPLATYLSQELFLTSYTNNLIRALFGIGDKNSEKVKQAFSLAKKLITLTAFVGYSNQNYQAQMLLHIDEKNKKITYYSIGEILENMFTTEKGYYVTPASILQFGGLDRDFKGDKKSKYKNHFQLINDQKDNMYSNFANAYVSVSAQITNQFLTK